VTAQISASRTSCAIGAPGASDDRRCLSSTSAPMPRSPAIGSWPAIRRGTARTSRDSSSSRRP